MTLCGSSDSLTFYSEERCETVTICPLGKHYFEEVDNGHGWCTACTGYACTTCPFNYCAALAPPRKPCQANLYVQQPRGGHVPKPQ